MRGYLTVKHVVDMGVLLGVLFQPESFGTAFEAEKHKALFLHRHSISSASAGVPSPQRGLQEKNNTLQ